MRLRHSLVTAVVAIAAAACAGEAFAQAARPKLGLVLGGGGARGGAHIGILEVLEELRIPISSRPALSSKIVDQSVALIRSRISWGPMPAA